MLQNVSRSWLGALGLVGALALVRCGGTPSVAGKPSGVDADASAGNARSEEHTSELQSQ